MYSIRMTHLWKNFSKRKNKRSFHHVYFSPYNHPFHALIHIILQIIWFRAWNCTWLCTCYLHLWNLHHMSIMIFAFVLLLNPSCIYCKKLEFMSRPSGLLPVLPFSIGLPSIVIVQIFQPITSELGNVDCCAVFWLVVRLAEGWNFNALSYYCEPKTNQMVST